MHISYYNRAKLLVTFLVVLFNISISATKIISSLYGRTAVGICSNDITLHKNPKLKKYNIVIKFNAPHSSTWSISEIRNTSLTIMSGVATYSFDPRTHYIIINLKLHQNSPAIATLVKPELVLSDFKAGLYFVRSDIKDRLYLELGQYPGSIINNPTGEFNQLLQKLGSTQSGTIENVNHAAFKQLGGLRYVHLVLQ